MDFWRAQDQKVSLAHCTIIIKWKKSRWGWGRADQACSCCGPCHHCCCWSSCYNCSSCCWDFWFTSTPQYNHQCVNEVEGSVIGVQGEAPQSNYQCVRQIHEFAAISIQSALWGYLLCLKKVSLSHISFLKFYLLSAYWYVWKLCIWYCAAC